MLLGFFSATVTIAAGFVVAFLAMKDHLGVNAWMTLGALSGSWIGGYDNIMEIQTALHIPTIDMEGAFIVDSIDYTIWVMFLFWLVTLAPRFNRWMGVDTAKLDAVSQAIEDDDARRTGDISFQGIFLLFGTSLLVSSVGADLGPLLYVAMPFLTQSIWTILFIAASGLIAAFSPLGRIAGSWRLQT